MKSSKYAGESMKASAAARGGKPGTTAQGFPKMSAGAASGPGRLQKTKAYGGTSKGK